MATYAFLSDEWIDAARHIYDAAEAQAQSTGDSGGTSITMNLVINNVPFRDSSLIAHARSTDGVFRLDLGPFENACIPWRKDPRRGQHGKTPRPAKRSNLTRRGCCT
jgi:hypothetical protein